MRRTMEENRRNNPEFTFHLFNDAECRRYIHDHFEADVLEAYDRLIPGAFKADLWRLCVMWREGGIYLDAKFSIRVPLREYVAGISGPWMVKDDWQPRQDQTSPYQGILLAPPGHPVFLRGIRKSVENVALRFYGFTCLEPTGPIMIANILSAEERATFFHFQMKPTEGFLHEVYDTATNTLYYSETRGYRLDQNMDMLKFGNQEHYTHAWKHRRVYKE